MADLLDAWNATDERAAILGVLSGSVHAIAAKRVQGPDSLHRAPVVEVYAAFRDGERLAVHFVVDFIIWTFAQSGSDYGYHDIHLGEAVFMGTDCVSETVADAAHILIEEHDEPSYDPTVAVRRVRDAAIAALREP